LKHQLQRKLGLLTTVSIVVGGVVGSGIFMKPAFMAAQLGSPILLLLVWLLAGVITLFGALTNAEVAAMMPETGGQYIFFRRMYGDIFAFLYGWAAFAVFNTAGVASIAYVLAQYTEYFVQLPRFDVSVEQQVVFHIPMVGDIFLLENIGVKLVTVFTIILLTVANYISVKIGGRIQVVFTALKSTAIALLIIVILFSGKGQFGLIVQNSEEISPQGFALLSAIMAAIAGAFWAYDGWNNITFIAGEIKNPQKNIPQSLLLGISTCVLIYLLINLAYLVVLPIDVIAKSDVVAADATKMVIGPLGAGLIALLVIISTFGTTNGNVMATSRVTFAMAQERHFFKFVGEVHPRFQTPANALLIHGIWTSILVFSGSFDTLTDMLIFVSWFFYGMSAVGLFILRRKEPETERPYKVWGYPYVPALFIIFTFVFLGITLFNDIANYISGESQFINSVFGVVLSLLGLPLYWYFKSQRSGR